MADRIPHSWQLLMVGPGVHRLTPELCDQLVHLFDLSPQTRLIDIETDQGGVSVSRDWPSDRIERVAAIEAEIEATPGIIRMIMFQVT